MKLYREEDKKWYFNVIITFPSVIHLFFSSWCQACCVYNNNVFFFCFSRSSSYALCSHMLSHRMYIILHCISSHLQQNGKAVAVAVAVIANCHHCRRVGVTLLQLYASVLQTCTPCMAMSELPSLWQALAITWGRLWRHDLDSTFPSRIATGRLARMRVNKLASVANRSHYMRAHIIQSEQDIRAHQVITMRQVSIQINIHTE